ncbi:MAG: hypothetical protein BGO87_03695 [Flavobacteriia bacterium 40-80]|nr:MAG: hypothetical protein BGO87_03695 [Flavobacteriia bacterium 40-80]
MNQKGKRKRFRDLSWTHKKQIFEGVFSRFTLDMGLFHGAALSFYLIFTLIPLLYLAVNVVGSIVGRATVTNVLNQYLIEYFGISDFSGILSFLESIKFGGDNVVFQNVGIVILLFSSSAIFISLKTSVNYFYGITPHFESGKKKFFVNLISRLISIALLGGFGVLLMAAYFAQLLFNSFGKAMLNNSVFISKFWLGVTQHGLSILLMMIFLTFVYRFLNDAIVKFRVALVGAFFASVLLQIGQFVIQYYMNVAYFAKSGSVISVILILLAFVYYGSQAIFIGASISAAYGELTNQPVISKYQPLENK